MDKQKLFKWADLLLDTGKRNNLINFKDTKSSTVEVVYPDFSTFFSRLEHNHSFEVFKPETDDIVEEYDEITGEVIVKKLSKDEYIDLYKKKIKKVSQILVYNSSEYPIDAIKTIGKKARTAIEETGVNIAYIAFGFVNWYEDEHNPQLMRAPLLLAPITITNDSLLSPYYIHIADDEIIVNPTFSFKLQNEYNIKLPDYDDEGVEEYLLKVERLISSLGWTVSNICKIGLFSFLKINMHRDLKDNANIILENKEVRVLLGEEGTLYNHLDNKENNSSNLLLKLHNVVDADSSQIEAIEMARSGVSFVLQGPPGTGKSQTITNIIAECLADGKKILFVSEKLAALNVVYEKLKRADLADFCLELHSHKANKKNVINELCHTFKLQKSELSSNAKQELEAKERTCKELDSYSDELHRKHDVINKSLYQIYQEISSCRDGVHLDYIINEINQKGEDYLNQIELNLKDYVNYVSSIGYDYHKNIWYGYKNLDCSYESLLKLKLDLKKVIELCDKLEAVNEILSDKYSFISHNIAESYNLRDFFNLIRNSKFITASLFNQPMLSKVKTIIESLSKSVETIFNKKDIILNVYNEDFFNLVGSDCFKILKHYDNFFTRIFSKEYRSLKKEIKFCLLENKKVKYLDMVKHIKVLDEYQKELKSFENEQKKVVEYLGEGFVGLKTDFNKLQEEVNLLVKLLGSIKTLGNLTKLSKGQFKNDQRLFNELYETLDKCLSEATDEEKRLNSYYDVSIFNPEKTAIESLKYKYRDCLDEIDKLDNWCEFLKLLEKLEELKVKSFVDYFIKQKISEEYLVVSYKKIFYLQWVDFIVRNSPLLKKLSRISHDDAVDEFKKKDILNFDINKVMIKARLSSERPESDLVAQNSAVGILLREGEKKRKQKNIRTLFAEIPKLVQTLKPCFLMSPLSVSTFLSSEMNFDVVIFDEASQIFPQDAIGAIYRGKQLIVVGDSKQMPPSNFFNSIATIEDDDEDDDVTDFESILDLCSVSFPQKRLKWHYRSRYEELISFSNKNFYDYDLVTFPSAKNDCDGIGVDYYYVDGIFDRKSKTNRIEAEKIVDLVFEHIEKNPDRSLGVVAFSISQQTLIERLLNRRRINNPSKEEFFSADKEEAFFIKNLETVQGDERDTIIFSVGYGKDEQGKLLMNFGPINKMGGERRLNVAITRAKINVQLVSSMHYTDIDLNRTKAVGTKLLREYLDYAENGDIALERVNTINTFEKIKKDFENEVSEFLKTKGYIVDTEVGSSSFKIDIAVKSKLTNDYVLAIECDGLTYHSFKNARDRDRLRQEVLENMGWKYYRIWSTDWFRNKNIEKERLLKAVKEAFNSNQKETNNNIKTNINFERIVSQRNFEFPEYKMVNEKQLAKEMHNDFLKVLVGIVKAEAPISEEWIIKRLLFLLGKEKVTSYVKQDFNRRVLGLEKYGIVRKNGFLYLINGSVPMLRIPGDNSIIREIKFIDLHELANGMREILKRNISVEKEGLFHLVTQKLGFARLGETITSRLEEALKLLSDEIEENNEMISLKE